MKKLIIIAIFSVAFLPTIVFAQATSTTSLPTYSGVESSIATYLCTPSEPPDGQDLVRCINKMYRFGITTGAIVLVLMLVVAGYIYITSGETGKGKAKGILMNSMVGMGILIGSYALLYFINPDLTTFKPIQPPIFTASLPSCAEVGLGEDCIAADGGISFGGASCSMPIVDSVVTAFNNSVHNPWDNNPETPDRHRPVRREPNGPPPLGAVDLKVSKQTPVYSPIDGKVDYRSKATALGGSGSYITLTSDVHGSGCSRASGCANLAHIDPSVNVGDTVKAGQQVGVTTVYSGDFGPHLHLELKLGGQWVVGDGKKGTWDNMKAAISKCAAAANSSGSGGSPPIDTSKVPAGMVEVTSSTHPGIQFDMKYASTDNFTGTKLYTHPKCYLTQSMSDKLKQAQTKLRAKNANYNLVIYDCYRPQAVQKLMADWAGGKVSWAAKQAPQPNDYLGKYIARATGGNHPSGKAVDLSISGLTMPSAFDEFSSKAGSSNDNSKLLKEVMSGFTPLASEWWHFSDGGSTTTFKIPPGSAQGFTEMDLSVNPVVRESCPLKQTAWIENLFIKKALAQTYVPKDCGSIADGYLAGPRHDAFPFHLTLQQDLDLKVGNPQNPTCSTIANSGCGLVSLINAIKIMRDKGYTTPGAWTQEWINEGSLKSTSDLTGLNFWIGIMQSNDGYWSCENNGAAYHSMAKEIMQNSQILRNVTAFQASSTNQAQLLKDIRATLKGGGVAIALVKGPPFNSGQKGNHYIVIWKEYIADSDGQSWFGVADSNKYAQIGQVRWDVLQSHLTGMTGIYGQ